MNGGKLLLFGATGDLAQRMLLPALYWLAADGLLPRDLSIVSTAREDLDDAAFRERTAAALQRSAPSAPFDEDMVGKFLARLRYVAVDAADPAAFTALA